jgi:hypothetical protein
MNIQTFITPNKNKHNQLIIITIINKKTEITSAMKKKTFLENFMGKMSFNKS